MTSTAHRLTTRFSDLAASTAPGSRTARLVDAVSRAHARTYRASGGRLGASMGGTAVALLTTTGRRSGQPRSATVGCLRTGDEVVVVASNAGRDAHPAWYLNLLDDPRVTVRIGRAEHRATACTAVGSERQRLWAAVVAAAPVMDDYRKRTSRVLPVVVLSPPA
ncbi:nitroreductase family deazaflavin-dependent oxidoreductase [Quadrisphaera setariae]|uniref:Nitroreductase family deazaflavin-dependent oxidoreductase n=1 Tax=Quadrisphaera setariae TaxID=2593304 RepID=A0A5C8Z6I6_9ACTN|nr:nitroreductase family deazaflavin-dependent oxidoreductase [Quadrisphaera setariae]TXR52919.1 nitroreductase family deazaflavin-dependent oxidoreductase [Quadrisphaera setariae]